MHKLLALSCVAVMAFATTANASNLSGAVYCDANRNQSIDAGDEPLSAVEVTADHDSGVFFADVTNVDGEYVIFGLLRGSYSAALTPGTLPADAIVVGGNEHLFVIDTENPFAERDWLITSAVCSGPVCGDGNLDAGEQCDDGNNNDGDGCSAICEEEIQVGGEGCTPGYWKQPHHFDSWASPYTPDTQFAEVFEDAFPGMTLVDVLAQGGGGLKALGRHVVAALLNTASEDVSYGMSTADVVDQFDATVPGRKSDYNGLKNSLMSLNEAGCPLN